MAEIQQIVPALAAAFPNAPVRTLHAEQLDDLTAADVPLVIIEPDSMLFGELDGFCNNGATADSVYSISFFALSLEDAWRMADVARGVMRQLNATIESQTPVWEPFMKVHRVTQVYEMFESNPSLT